MKVFRSLGTCTSQCALAYDKLINRREAVGALAYNESINRRVTIGWCGLRELWLGFCAALKSCGARIATRKERKGSRMLLVAGACIGAGVWNSRFFATDCRRLHRCRCLVCQRLHRCRCLVYRRLHRCRCLELLLRNRLGWLLLRNRLLLRNPILSGEPLPLLVQVALLDRDLGGCPILECPVVVGLSRDPRFVAWTAYHGEQMGNAQVNV